MRKIILHSTFIIIILCAIPLIAAAQIFPIANGSDNTMGGGGAFDGTNMLLSIRGDSTGPNVITVQRVSPGGTLVGSRIATGKTGSSPMLAFDGSRYLMVWTDVFPIFAGGDTNGIGNIYGQFIETSGASSGNSFTIATDVNIKFGQGRGSIQCYDTTYIITYVKGPDHHTDYLYAQRIGKSGALIGTPVQISSQYAREHAVAFDGTNFLIAWCKVDHPATDDEIMGQLLSSSGALVGGNFVIDGSEVASDNPVTMVFDGSRYLVMFHDQAIADGDWNLIGRFVTPSGTPAERFLICDSTKSPFYVTAAFDGRNYMITWIERAGSTRIRGQYYTVAGTPINSAFTLFDTSGGKFPMGGVGGFLEEHFFVSAVMIDSAFSDLDIYGLLWNASPTAIVENGSQNSVRTFALDQNFPNPFNPSTTITYSLSSDGPVLLTVSDLLGRTVATPVNEIQHRGTHRITFNAGNLSSGVYIYSLRAGLFTDIKKMILMR